MFICFEASSSTSVYKRPDSLRFIIAVESRHRLRSAMNDAQQPIVRARARGVSDFVLFSMCFIVV